MKRRWVLLSVVTILLLILGAAILLPGERKEVKGASVVLRHFPVAEPSLAFTGSLLLVLAYLMAPPATENAKPGGGFSTPHLWRALAVLGGAAAVVAPSAPSSLQRRVAGRRAHQRLADRLQPLGGLVDHLDPDPRRRAERQSVQPGRSGDLRGLRRRLLRLLSQGAQGSGSWSETGLRRSTLVARRTDRVASWLWAAGSPS